MKATQSKMCGYWHMPKVSPAAHSTASTAVESRRIYEDTSKVRKEVF